MSMRLGSGFFSMIFRATQENALKKDPSWPIFRMTWVKSKQVPLLRMRKPAWRVSNFEPSNVGLVVELQQLQGHQS